jgi:hypothetical protein
MEALEYKCPNCSGGIVFDSTSQNLTCPYCDTSFEIDALIQYNQSLENVKTDSYGWQDYTKESGTGDWEEGELEGISEFRCPSCGGEIVGNPNTVATSCVYCGNPAILMSQLQGMYKPDYIIPFKLDKNAAKSALIKHLRFKPLLPKSFKDENRIESLTGIYVPFWLFDCDVDASIRFKATRTQVWSDSEYRYTRTSYYLVLRNGSMSFEMVPVDGSEKMDDEYMEAIEPFDYSQISDFKTPYLSGYIAEKYDIDAEQSKPRANKRIKTSVEDIFRSTVKGYNSVVTENSNISFYDGKIHYALLPVWMLNTKYKGKIYSFSMNGQTGRFVGELPVSMGRFWAWTFGLTSVFTAVASLIYLLFM